MNVSSLFASISLRLFKSWRRLHIKELRVSPGVYQKIKSTKIQRILFLLNCPYSLRLGDTLFFKDAIDEVSNAGLLYTIYANATNYELLNMITGESNKVIIGDVDTYNEDDLVIFPIGNTCVKVNYLKSFLCLDPHTYTYIGTIKEFYKNALATVLSIDKIKSNRNSTSKYIFVSLDVGSQKFMTGKSSIQSIIDFARMLAKRNESSIIYFTNDNIKLEKNDKIFRPNELGLKKFDELIDNAICIVSFDSFIMHYAHMRDKIVFVKFRGKLSKKEFNAHYKHINNAFSEKVLYF